MYLITGATGNTGSVVAKGLLKQGKKVRVIARRQEKLNELASLGAETLIGDITFQDTANRAFAGIEAAYVMIPPAMTDPRFSRLPKRSSRKFTGLPWRANSSVMSMSSSLAASAPTKTPRPVPYSAFIFSKSSPQTNQAAELPASLRAGYFMENTLGQVGAIHQMGAVVQAHSKPDLKIHSHRHHRYQATPPSTLFCNSISRAIKLTIFRGNAISRILKSQPS